MRSSVKVVAAIILLSLAENSEAFSTPTLNLLSPGHSDLKNKCGMGQLHRAEFSTPTRRAGLILRQVTDGKDGETVDICEKKSSTEPKTWEERFSDFENRITFLETTISKHEKTILEQGRTILKHEKTILDQGRTILKHENTILDQGRTISKLSGQVFMFSKLQAVLQSIQVMSWHLGLSESQDDHDPPTYAKRADKAGSELRDMLKTVLKIPDHALNHTIELIDDLWHYRHKVAHPVNAMTAETMDDLISVLKEKKDALDERELLALSILEERDLIWKAPRCMLRSGKKAAPVTPPSPPLNPKAQQRSSGKGSKNLRINWATVTARPVKPDQSPPNLAQQQAPGPKA